jgi:hypothetical protein
MPLIQALTDDLQGDPLVCLAYDLPSERLTLRLTVLPDVCRGYRCGYHCE